MLCLLLYPLHERHAWLLFLRVLQCPSFRITAAFDAAPVLGYWLESHGAP